jgi:hypothetical protein
MTAVNPYTLWDVGFQLSFAATAGLIWLVPPLERAAGRWLALTLGPGSGRAALGLLSEALLVTLAAVDPQVAVISVGADNRFGHSDPDVLARYAEHGIPVLRTDERGTIELSTDGERLWVETTH